MNKIDKIKKLCKEKEVPFEDFIENFEKPFEYLRFINGVLYKTSVSYNGKPSFKKWNRKEVIIEDYKNYLD